MRCVLGPCWRRQLLVSPLGGERRFASSVVRKLESLGALTQGDRRAAGVARGWGCFNLDTPLGRKASRGANTAEEE